MIDWRRRFVEEIRVLFERGWLRFDDTSKPPQSSGKTVGLRV